MRLWEDGFDHYGSDISNMLDGSYATVQGQLSTDQFATGTHSFYFNSTVFTSHGSGILRKVLPTAVTGLGKMCRIYMPSLPVNSNQLPVIMGIPTLNTDDLQCAVVVDTNGALALYRGMHLQGSSSSLGTLIYRSDPVLVAAAQNHVEIQLGFDNSAGFFRCAINGVPSFEVTGLDTLSNSDPVLSDATFLYSSASVSSGGNFYMDDYVLYDFTGDSAVDTDFCPTMSGSIPTGYIGELQVWPLFENGDTAEADWQPSTGTDVYPLIGKTAPDDLTFAYSTAVGDLSEWALEDLPENITYIRGLGLHQRLSKSDAGAAMTKVGMKSVAATSDADERPVTVEPTYWRDTVDVDPDSSARWTRPSLNAAWLRLTRSI
jgi:hypothetical protein